VRLSLRCPSRPPLIGSIVSPAQMKERASYSIERAALIADQLERLATQNLHQLAGQAANLIFWISEAAHAIRTIDEYPARFRRLREAQVG